MAKSCYAIAAKETLQVTALDSRGDSRKGRQERAETLNEVLVNKDDMSKRIKIRSSLDEAIRGELVKCL